LSLRLLLKIDHSTWGKSMAFRTPSKNKQTVAMLKRRALIRDDFLNGMSTDDLATRHGVSKMTIARYLKAILKEMAWEDKEQGVEKLILTERRLMTVFSKAADSFERSKKDATETSTQYKPKTCPACEGSGRKGAKRLCRMCEGEGRIFAETTTKKVKGQSGDANFLRVQLDCLKEVNRIRGHYPKEYADGTNNRHLHIHQGPTIDLSNVSDDVLLKALETVDLLRNPLTTEVAETVKVSQQLAIDVESKEVTPATKRPRKSWLSGGWVRTPLG